jgi:hypothetical protein
MEIKEMCNVPDTVLEILQRDVAEIKVALLGNAYNPSGGLLSRTAELEKELEKMKLRYQRLLWTAAGVGSAIGVVFNVAFQVFNTFVNR